jgi:hypothetical protein
MVTGLAEDVESLSKLGEITLMLHSNERIIKYKLA